MTASGGDRPPGTAARRGRSTAFADGANAGSEAARGAGRGAAAPDKTPAGAAAANGASAVRIGATTALRLTNGCADALGSAAPTTGVERARARADPGRGRLGLGSADPSTAAHRTVAAAVFASGAGFAIPDACSVGWLGAASLATVPGAALGLPVA